MHRALLCYHITILFILFLLQLAVDCHKNKKETNQTKENPKRSQKQHREQQQQLINSMIMENTIFRSTNIDSFYLLILIFNSKQRTELQSNAFATRWQHYACEQIK